MISEAAFVCSWSSSRRESLRQSIQCARSGVWRHNASCSSISIGLAPNKRRRTLNLLKVSFYTNFGTQQIHTTIPATQLSDLRFLANTLDRYRSVSDTGASDTDSYPVLIPTAPIRHTARIKCCVWYNETALARSLSEISNTRVFNWETPFESPSIQIVFHH